MKWYLVLGAVLSILLLASASVCVGSAEYTYWCHNAETECEDQYTTEQCVADAGDESCIQDSGSGLCCDNIYYSDLVYQGGPCEASHGPRGNQGWRMPAPLSEDDALTARVYVPACGGNYMILELSGEGS